MPDGYVATPLLSALADLQPAVTALDPSESYADMLPQFESVALALAHAKTEKAILENASKPVFSLPPEITSSIFEIGRNMRDAERGDNILPSLYVSHVSRVWRGVAISTPSLWATLRSIPRRSIQFYEMLVERSQTSMLDVIIRLENRGANDEHARLLLTLSLPHSHRWRQLRISASCRFLSWAIINLRDLSTPHLTLLQITDGVPKRCPRTQSLAIRILTGGAERLFTFISMTKRKTCCPSLTTLTTLVLSVQIGYAYDALCEVLRETSATLAYIALTVAFVEPISQPIQSIVMPSLVQIEVTAVPSHPEHIFTVLATILAPSALGLRISTPHVLRWPECLSIFGTIGATHRYPLLTVLQLCGELGGGVLAVFPTITALEIMEQEGTRNNIGNLFSPRQNGFAALVPLLSYIGAPPSYEAEVGAFAAARLALGFTALVFQGVHLRIRA